MRTMRRCCSARSRSAGASAEMEVPRFRPLQKLPAVVAYLALRYQRRTQEVMGALFLDGGSGCSSTGVSTGARSPGPPSSRAPSWSKRSASRPTAVVLFHTHPSGDPSPSLEDIAFTRRMAQAGEALGVELLDHLVIGGVRRWVSLRERGAFA